MDDATLWHYAVGEERKGPVSAQDIRALLTAGSIGGDTLVWREGMAEWQPLGRTELGAGLAPDSAQVTDFRGAISTCFRKYATFSGRANRPEYWYFALFMFLVSIAASIVDAMLFDLAVSPLSSLWSLAVLVPSLAVSVRRLHDTDRTGWWLLVMLIPLLGLIVLIVFFCQRGTQGPNRFDSPRA